MNHTVITRGAKTTSAPDPTTDGPVLQGPDRRQALAWLAGGSALALAACGKPQEEILPYVQTPEGLLTGMAQRYATTLPLAGYGRGALVTAHDGRPTKVSGSPAHPASLGSTDVFLEAEVLSLYDPARAQTVEGPEGPTAWSAFQAALLPRLAAAQARRGAGLALLTGRVTSPTELRLIRALQARYPAMAWRRFEAVDDDAERAGARLAFGRQLSARPALDRARAILCIGADPLGPGPDQIAFNRAFADGRQPGGSAFSRLYVVEAGWSLTGLNADHRLAAGPADAATVLHAVAVRLGLSAPDATLAPAWRRFADAAAIDLMAHRGAGLVLVGPTQPAPIHALAHRINARLQAPVAFIEAVDPHPEDHRASLAAFTADLCSGRTQTVVVLGDPLHDAPSAALATALSQAFTIHAGTHGNATAKACRWRLPLAHPLESWGDLRATDGTPSLVQPLIRPLYDTRTATQLLAMLDLDFGASDYGLARRTWSEGRGAAEFEGLWRTALSKGVIGPPASSVEPSFPRSPAPPAGAAMEAAAPFTLTLSPDPTVFDGRYADNAWLQECPKPFTHEVWGASIAIAPGDAARLGLRDGAAVRLTRGAVSLEAAIRLTPGQAPGTLSGHLGGGRAVAGPIGAGVGVNLASLRGPEGAWSVPVRVAPSGDGRGAPPRFTTSHRIDGAAADLSPVIGFNALATLEPLEAASPAASLLPTEAPHAPAWGMVIDAAACTGCNACVVACQSENNVPVVGPHEVARGRDMHWLRIDAYDVGPTHPGSDEVRPAFQPVPCMQCEHAPCEPVCPVEASVHDHEGLNAQVYNRCIGTRFCESNCPYQVRRFNFYGYGHDQAYADLGAESLKAQKNPEVTVRSRGVMEKCTYCVQRISAARRTSEKEDRAIRDGEVTTACQDACPTRAIRFGDLSDPASPLHAARAQPRHYALLAELGTRPRTTYLARIRNPNPRLAEPPR